MMDRETVRARRDEVATRHGEWTAHDIRLVDGVSTRPGHPDTLRLRQIVQLAADLTARPLGTLRVLDLGALEGQYAIEFALQGAEVVAIEGRLANIEKARFAREVLGLERLELLQEDVRGLSAERHGTFDVVLCLGLLYHLDASDVFPFLDRLAEVCTRLLVLDTHIGLSGRTRHTHGGREYRGLTFVEHSPRASSEQRARSLWASIDNAESFWPTRASLLNALAQAGFTSVLDCGIPALSASRDRVTFAALRGSRPPLRSLPAGVAESEVPAAERPRARFVRNQSRLFLLAKRAALYVLALRDRRSTRARLPGRRPS
jgi:SAM-dependent methyltransferase